MKKLKQIVALVLSLVMILTCVPSFVSESNAEGPEPQININVGLSNVENGKRIGGTSFYKLEFVYEDGKTYPCKDLSVVNREISTYPDFETFLPHDTILKKDNYYMLAISVDNGLDKFFGDGDGEPKKFPTNSQGNKHIKVTVDGINDWNVLGQYRQIKDNSFNLMIGLIPKDIRLDITRPEITNDPDTSLGLLDKSPIFMEDEYKLYKYDSTNVLSVNGMALSKIATGAGTWFNDLYLIKSEFDLSMFEFSYDGSNHEELDKLKSIKYNGKEIVDNYFESDMSDYEELNIAHLLECTATYRIVDNTKLVIYELVDFREEKVGEVTFTEPQLGMKFEELEAPVIFGDNASFNATITQIEPVYVMPELASFDSTTEKFAPRGEVDTFDYGTYLLHITIKCDDFDDYTKVLFNGSEIKLLDALSRNYWSWNTPADGDTSKTFIHIFKTFTFNRPSSKKYSAKTESSSLEKISGSGKKGSTRTITPLEGKKVGKVIVTDKDGNKVEVTPNADGTYSFIQPASNVTVEVTYVNREITLTIGSMEADVDGETSNLDVCPVIRNDRTMLPIRFIAENLGAKVEWNEKNPNYVVIEKEGIKIEITLGSDVMKVNGKDVKLDSAAFAENDRTYLPVRAVSENLNAIVEWNEARPMEVKIYER